MFYRTAPIASIFLVFLLLIPCHAQWNVDLETGFVFSGYNDVRIPNKTGTLISLSQELKIDPKFFYRMKVIYSFNERHSLAVLVAPLRLKAKGTVDRFVRFEEVEFPPNRALQGRYRFDSYRLTYRYDFHRSEDITAGIGVTAKIRDASISLEGADRVSEKKNTGFVPLINFRIHWMPDRKIHAVLDGDALAAPQGRAEDVLVAIQYQLQKNYGLRFGYRILEGGADVEETYNFALLHYVVLGAAISF